MDADLVVGPGAAAVRRAVGTTAWVALESLAAQSVVDSDGWCGSASVRQLAEEMGVSKNSAHRALRRLTAAGLVVARQSRAADGRFTSGFYLIHVPADVLRPIAVEPTAPAASRTRTSRRRPAPGQLDLLATA